MIEEAEVAETEIPEVKIAVIEVDGEPVELEFPAETTDDVMDRAVKDYIVQNGSYRDKVNAFRSMVPPSPQEVVADTALTVGQGLTGLTAAGIAGTAHGALGGKHQDVAKTIETVSNLIAHTPKNEETNAVLHGMQWVMENGIRLLQGAIAEANTQIAAVEDATQDPPPFGETFQAVMDDGAGNTMIDRGYSPGQATAVDTITNAALFNLPGSISRAFKQPARQGKGLMQPKPEEPPISPRDTERARQMVAGAFKADELPVRGGRKELAELGDEGVPADMGGPVVRDLAHIATQVTAKGRAAGDAAFGTRLGEVRTRAIGFIKDKLTKGSTFLKEQERIMRESKKAAKDHYDAFFASKIDNTAPQMREVMRDPNILDSMPKAKKRILQDTDVPQAEKSALKPKKPDPNVIVTAESVTGPVTPPRAVRTPQFNPSPRFWDSVKRRMSARIEKAKKAGDNDLARILTRSQEKLVTELKRQSDLSGGHYSRALDIWSDRHSALNALEEGRRTFTNFGKADSIEFTKQQFDALSTIDKQLYRIAGGEKMIENMKGIKDTATSGSPPSEISNFAGSQASRELLGTIFEKPADLAAFNKFIANERRMATTNKAAAATDAKRIKLQQQFSSKPVRAHLAALGTDVLFAMNQNRFATLRLIDNVLGGGKSRRITPEVLNEVARILTEKPFKAELNEIARINGEIPKGLRPMMEMDTQAMAKWLASKQNRRELAEFGARAFLVETAMNQEQN